MSMFFRKTIACAVALTIAAPAAFAAEPVVKGPESVQDWFNNGQKFIADSKKIFPNVRKAKNVKKRLTSYARINAPQPAELSGSFRAACGRRVRPVAQAPSPRRAAIPTRRATGPGSA